MCSSTNKNLPLLVPTDFSREKSKKKSVQSKDQKDSKKKPKSKD